jgi:hypothetical protein
MLENISFTIASNRGRHIFPLPNFMEQDTFIYNIRKNLVETLRSVVDTSKSITSNIQNRTSGNSVGWALSGTPVAYWEGLPPAALKQ